MTKDEIEKGIQKVSESSITGYLEELMAVEFVARDHTWQLKTGKSSNMSRYRISDCYTRFYLKYIEPMKHKIELDQFVSGSMGTLREWMSVMGLQFEALVLSNRHLLWEKLNINPIEIVCDNPFFQRPTSRHEGCQIDYLIQTKFNTVYVCEKKFSQKEIGSSIISEVQEKIRRLALPRNFSYRPVLIHVNGVSEAVEELGYFAHIADFGSFL